MARPDEAPALPAPTPEAPSKTRRKAAMHALQDLGEALVGLDSDRLAQLDLPERLVDAVTSARGIRAHEGRRRQLQYIGKLMRDIDPGPIRAALARWTAGSGADQARVRAAEQWREALLREEAAVDRFVARHPAIERTELATLVGEARAERARGGPPHRYRELFRRVLAASTATVDIEPTDA